MSHSVLITGGAGFIGRAVVGRCLADGMQVTVYDNLCAGRLANLAEFRDRVTFIEGDINDAETLNAAMSDAAPQTVFHLAAHHFIPYCNAHPAETLRVNVEGSYAVLKSAAEHGVSSIVAASSGVLYAGREGPLSETETPEIIDIYGLSKRMTEEILQLMARTTGLRCIAARLFNTYGPYETNPHVIPHIINSLKESANSQESLKVRLGNIHPKRDYIFVEDTADLLFYCSQIPEKHVTVNVGTGWEFSVEEIVTELAALLGRPIEILVDPDRVRPVDKLHQIADTTRLRELTGREARHTLRAGLRKLLVHEQML